MTNDTWGEWIPHKAGDPCPIPYAKAGGYEVKWHDGGHHGFSLTDAINIDSWVRTSGDIITHYRLRKPILPETGWMIHKDGRGWYRPKAQGYTINPTEAGRYVRDEAVKHSHPNGIFGPRDGMEIFHESEVAGAISSPAVDWEEIGNDAIRLLQFVSYFFKGGKVTHTADEVHDEVRAFLVSIQKERR